MWAAAVRKWQKSDVWIMVTLQSTGSSFWCFFFLNTWFSFRFLLNKIYSLLRSSTRFKTLIFDQRAYRVNFILKIYYRKCGYSLLMGTGCSFSQPVPLTADTMVRTEGPLLVLLALAASCQALLAPPTLEINLDDKPEVRWMPLKKAFDVGYLKEVAAEIVE